MAASAARDEIAERERTGSASQVLSDALHFAFATQRYGHAHSLSKLSDAMLDEHEARLLRDLDELRAIRRQRAVDSAAVRPFPLPLSSLGLPCLHPRPSSSFMRAVEEITPHAFSFPVVSAALCDAILAHMEAIVTSPAAPIAPHDSNRFHIPLQALGLADFAAALLNDVITPMVRILYPTLCACTRDPCPHTGAALDFQYAYVIGYNATGSARSALRPHTDDSEVTLNISLGRAFTGGDLILRGLRGTASEGVEEARVALAPGHALLHLGQQLHEVAPVTAGERYALIVWCRSSAFRRATCPCCLIQRSQGPCVCDGWLT